jgi:hypothetical protein
MKLIPVLGAALLGASPSFAGKIACRSAQGKITGISFKTLS